jgi:xanthine dehydrogenase accessory factor
MTPLKSWNLILNSLKKQIPVMLLYVLDSKGSSPGRQGFMMAVNATGDMEGSIGGGIMEYKFVEMAKEKLKEHETIQTIRKQIHDKSAADNQSGMICSGEQTLLMYTVSAQDINSITQLVDSLKMHKNGTLEISEKGLAFSTAIPRQDYYYNYTSEQQWIYREKTGPLQQLTIIGGGHCSLALSRLMGNMGFYIRVYDNRSGLKTMEENTYANEKLFVDNYPELQTLIADNENEYVVVMTLGYRTDADVVMALAGKKFRYIGVLGSKNKMQKLKAEFIQKGLPESWLEKIYAPIGLAIQSQTPEEIAVSIAGEIVKIKNQSLHHPPTLRFGGQSIGT